MELGVTAVMLPEMDFQEQITVCRSAGVRYYQYRPRIIPMNRRDERPTAWGNHKFDLTPERLAREGPELTRQLRAAGMEPWGTVPSENVNAPDDALRLNADGAAAAEARGMRCGPAACPKEPFDYGEFLKRIVERFEHVIHQISAPCGIKLLIETHTGSLAASPGLAWNICRHFPPDKVGVIFDLANFAREGEINPVLAVSVLKEYMDCVHVGGTRRVEMARDALGCRQVQPAFCPLEESDLHLPTWLKTLRQAGLEPPLIIEDYTPGKSGAEKLSRAAAFLQNALAAL